MPSLTRKHYFAYALICLIWGSTWGAIRLLVRDVPPIRAAAIRFFLAAIILLGIALVRARTLSLSSREWRALLILGITMMGLPYGLLFWAEYRISSSMTAVLFSTCPLFVALFTPLMTRTHVPRRAVFAMLLGLGAMATLFYTELSVSRYLLLGGGAVIGAVISSSWASVFAKREIGNVSPLLGTAVQFCVGAVVLCIASLMAERGRGSDWNSTSILALVFLTIFGSVITFSVYYWLLGKMQAYQLSTINLVVPIVAMAEGALLLRERLPVLMIAAAVLVLVSVATVLRAEDESQITLRVDVDAGLTEGRADAER
ncbi:MAG TPA: EamA family transporter [Terriglobales bacterium]|jgi:drug/metabolite transporter (DMT)-like permease|nr:EamA family transporter [Terriglobales bacterium]